MVMRRDRGRRRPIVNRAILARVGSFAVGVRCKNRWPRWCKQFRIWTEPKLLSRRPAISTATNSINFGEPAEAGENDFLAVFLPWSIDPTYRTKLPDNFTMTPDEIALADLHGLDAEQICWRRNKIANMLGNLDRFKSEFPLSSR